MRAVEDGCLTTEHAVKRSHRSRYLLREPFERKTQFVRKPHFTLSILVFAVLSSAAPCVGSNIPYRLGSQARAAIAGAFRSNADIKDYMVVDSLVMKGYMELEETTMQVCPPC